MPIRCARTTAMLSNASNLIRAQSASFRQHVRAIVHARRNSNAHRLCRWRLHHHGQQGGRLPLSRCLWHNALSSFFRLQDGIIKFWKKRPHEIEFIKKFFAHTGSVRDIAISSDGLWLATLGEFCQGAAASRRCHCPLLLSRQRNRLCSH